MNIVQDLPTSTPGESSPEAFAGIEEEIAMLGTIHAADVLTGDETQRVLLRLQISLRAMEDMLGGI